MLAALDIRKKFAEACADDCGNLRLTAFSKDLKMAVRRVVAIPSEANRLLLTDYYLAY